MPLVLQCQTPESLSLIHIYGTSLNIWDGYIYYIVDEKEGSVIKKADLETGVSEKVLQTSDKAKQLSLIHI